MKHSKEIDDISDKIDDMLGESVAYFSKLYERHHRLADADLCREFLENIYTLTHEQKTECEGILTEAELRAALFSLKNDTAPGPNGYSAEFFKFFWDELKDIFLSMVQEVQTAGKAKQSFKKSVTILIPKRNKDQRFIENFRLVSLLYVTYKIYTKAIALRLNKVMKHCIGDDQTGFIKGRYIGENVRLMLDIRDHCITNDRKALLLACDCHKAFDSLNWEYIETVMKGFGFGPDMLNLVRSIYASTDGDSLPQSVVQLNGFLSQPYSLNRGVRQGCPLSCYLFLLCIEPLLAYIRSSNAIRGYQHWRLKLLLTQMI